MMSLLRLSVWVALCLVATGQSVEAISSNDEPSSFDSFFLDNNDGRRLQNSTTHTDDGIHNFRATYKGRFQALADGCEGPPPVVQAACVGTSIKLVWVSDFAKLVCDETSSEDLPAGFQSGLTCRTACHDPEFEGGDPDECAASLYANDGSYTTTEGPWGEIVYECQGATVEQVDTIFRYQDTGDGSCYWRLFFGNEIYHLVQLGVLCEDETSNSSHNDTLIPNNNNETIDGDGIWTDQNVLEVVISRTELSPFNFDDSYFECSLGDEAAIDFEGPTKDDVLCAVGDDCGGDDCDVPFHTIHVHADVHKFDQKRCITVLNPDAVLVEKDNTTAPVLPAGNYTVRFKAGWSILFKNPEFWYDLDDIYCLLGGDFNTIESLPPVRLTCPNGVIRLVEIEDATSKSIECWQTEADTLECVGDIDNWQSHVNTFSTVVYECTSNSTFPTTTVNYPSNNVTCLDQIYDDLAVGQALQIGHFCRTDIDNQEQDISVNSFDSLEGNYRYDDFYYECGDDNQYLLLDGNTESLGDRFTCLETVPVVPSTTLSLPQGPALSFPLREVNMTTDWREDEGGATVGVGPDPLCYVFEPQGVNIEAAQEPPEQDIDGANSTDVTVSNVTTEP